MKPTAVALVLFALVLPSFADDAPPKGMLCFMNAKEAANCRSTEGDVVHVDAADAERPFVWSSADGKSVRVAVLPPKATDINVTDDTLGKIALSIRGDRRRGWPADVRVDVTDANKRQWSLTVPAKTAEALAELRLPVGKYGIVLVAAHHLTERRRVDLAKNASLREIDLRPIPTISGRVFTTDDKPIADARIARPDGKLLASTDEQGNFRAEAGDPPADSVFVQKAGFGSPLIPLQLATGSADLGIIRLGKALELTLRILRPDSDRDELKVSLQRNSEFKYENTDAASKHLPANEEKLAFGNLSKGTYYVVVEGKTTSEKLTVEAVLDKESVEKEIRIEPYRLDGTARLGDDPITGSLEVSGQFLADRFSHTIRFKLPVENGRFGGTFWQHGKLTAWLQVASSSQGEPINSPMLGDDPSAWDIRLPKRFITGRIYDAETQQPVPKAELAHLITWRSDTSNGRLYGGTTIKEDGTFSILATKPGTYELKVTAPDYVADKQTVEIRDSDGSMQRDFALTKGIATTIEFVWPSGAPVVNAPVIEGVASDGHNAERHYSVDASGRVSLRLRRGEARTLFIVPPEGSFAIARVVGEEGGEQKPVRVVVPPAAGSLSIRVLDGDGKPVAPMIGMRYNGELVPTPVLFSISYRAASALNDKRLLQMPAGAYELWPMSQGSSSVLGPSKSVSLSSGDVDVELVTTAKQ